MPIKQFDIPPTPADILQTAAAYRAAYDAQHAYTAASRRLGEALFELKDSMGLPIAEVSLSDGRNIPLHRVADTVSELSLAALSTDEADSKAASHEEIDGLLTQAANKNPDYATMLSAVSSANYFLTGKEYPSRQEVSLRHAWLDQTNPEDIIATKAREHYLNNNEIYEQQALEMAEADGKEIVVEGPLAYASDVSVERGQ